MTTPVHRSSLIAILILAACGGAGPKRAESGASPSKEVTHSANLEKVSDPAGFSMFVPMGAKRSDRGFAEGGKIEFEVVDTSDTATISMVNVAVMKASPSGREVAEQMAGQAVHLPNGDLYHSGALWFFMTSCCTVQVVAQGKFADQAKEIATSFEGAELHAPPPPSSARAMTESLVMRKDPLKFSLKLPPSARRSVRSESGGVMLAGATTTAPVKTFVEYTIQDKIVVGIEKDPIWPGSMQPPDQGKLETLGRGERLKIRTLRGHYLVECKRLSGDVSKETLEAICASFEESP